jgi:uncharacterized repeat protein (TIGR03803 family)
VSRESGEETSMRKFNWGMRACVAFLLWATTAVALPAQGLTTLYSFDGTDGQYPEAALVQASDGNVYGTTALGGNNSCRYGCGTVFKITPNGTLTTLHAFDGTDGIEPFEALAQAPDGNFYGTTVVGGAVDTCNPPYGCGTVFKITSSGALTTLHRFDNTDGANPYAGLIQATDGDFYGTTAGGGTNGGYGTVFKITRGGTLTTLHSFDGADGSFPQAPLIQATDGDFYGTTAEGGLGIYGTVFKITPSGKLTTLHSFDVKDGNYPYAGLVQATNGNFYGTTSSGGTGDCYKGCGTVFKITPSGTLTTLHSFDGADGDGNYPFGGLVQATNENFYGTTARGGANYRGTVFRITSSGTLTTVHSFEGTDGREPYAGLLQDTNGNFYGTTFGGGANGVGTVFRLSVGLGPFVEAQPTSGKVGKAVKILGTNLTGATSVTFNGTAATFTVKSKSEITTTVPFGATTGTVQVVTPGGTLLSNVPFRVR